jgi:hypothetical protein
VSSLSMAEKDPKGPQKGPSGEPRLTLQKGLKGVRGCPYGPNGPKGAKWVPKWSNSDPQNSTEMGCFGRFWNSGLLEFRYLESSSEGCPLALRDPLNGGSGVPNRGQMGSQMGPWLRPIPEALRRPPVGSRGSHHTHPKMGKTECFCTIRSGSIWGSEHPKSHYSGYSDIARTLDYKHSFLGLVPSRGLIPSPGRPSWDPKMAPFGP